MHNLTQSQAQARCNSTFSPLADAVQSCIQVSQFAQGHYCPSGKRIMLPWKLIKFSFLLKDSLKVLEETNEKQGYQRETSSRDLVSSARVLYLYCMIYLTGPS